MPANLHDQEVMLHRFDKPPPFEIDRSLGKVKGVTTKGHMPSSNQTACKSKWSITSMYVF